MNGDGSIAGPMDYGSGHIRPKHALDPGLVYDASYQDFQVSSRAPATTPSSTARCRAQRARRRPTSRADHRPSLCLAWPPWTAAIAARLITSPSSVPQVILPVHPRSSLVSGFFRSLVLIIDECFFQNS